MALAHYQGYVENVSTGKALPDAVIRVYSFPANVLQSTFADPSSTPKPVVSSDANGAFNFYIPDGVYDLEYVYNGDVLTRLTNIPIYNPANALPAADLGAFGQTLVANATAADARADLQLYEVNVKQYGAVGNGITDDTTAIQAALNTGKTVWLPTGSYAISATIRFASDGQIIYGDGTGNPSEPARARLKWIGASGGKMFSVSNGITENWQNCTLRDVHLDGNSLANIGVECYASAVSGGAWRNRFINVTISGLVGANSTGFHLGDGAFPNFAHDPEITGCFVISAVRGAYGTGAIHRFTNTTFSGCTNAVVGLAGSTWSFVGCVFSQSTQYDFTGSQILNANFEGCWFEDSGSGIYNAAISHTVGFFGCTLQTSSGNTTQLMSWGNAAGYAAVKGCTVGATTGSTLIKNVNATSEYDITGSNCTIESGYRVRGQGASRFDQYAFAAGLAADIANVTGDTTMYVVNTLAWTEDYDLQSRFNAATGVFTADKDGQYQFTCQLSLSNVAAGHDDAQLFLNVGGQLYLLSRLHPGNLRTGGGGNEVVLFGSKSISVLAGQTAFMQIYVGGSTKTIGLASGGTGTAWRTRFEGRLI